MALLISTLYTIHFASRANIYTFILTFRHPPWIIKNRSALVNFSKMAPGAI